MGAKIQALIFPMCAGVMHTPKISYSRILVSIKAIPHD